MVAIASVNPNLSIANVAFTKYPRVVMIAMIPVQSCSVTCCPLTVTRLWREVEKLMLDTTSC